MYRYKINMCLWEQKTNLKRDLCHCLPTLPLKSLKDFGYVKSNKGKTSGSRIIYKDANGHPIMIHRPHPGNIIKEYAMKQILKELQDKGKI